MIRTLSWLSLSVVGTACAPDTTALFNAMSLDVTDADEGEARFVQAVEAAAQSLHIALPDAKDPALLDAIAVAHGNGLEVELIVDVDELGQPALQELLDAGVPTTLSSDGLSYFEFNLNRVVSWDSDETFMSHAYVVIDRQRIVSSTTAGHQRPGARVVFDLRGEELIEDWLIEHNQIFGGVDATAVTAFDAPAKSIADFRWRYGTGTATELEVWFGPQERLTKRVIDAIYSARSAVWVLSDEIANEGIIAALREKHRWGFDVRSLTGPALGTTYTPLRREYDQQLANVPRRERLDVDELPTLVLIDPFVDNGAFATASKAMVLSHDLYGSSRLYGASEILTDQLIDGNLLVLANRSDDDRAEIDALVDLYEAQWALGVPR